MTSPIFFLVISLLWIKSFVRSSYWREVFHYCDRATIYVFIASSYTPWLYLRSTKGMFGESMVIIVWLAAICGIAYQIIFHEKYKLLEIVFYLVVSICPSVVIIDMVNIEKTKLEMNRTGVKICYFTLRWMYQD